jgi:hypothetical protein
MPRTLAAVLILLVTLSPVIAAAQSSSGDKAAADALFDEGKRLLAAGDTAQACGKFETSMKLFDQLGTRLNLADCFEKAGRTASAWAEFREAASLAAKRGDRRARYARDRADTLQPKLITLAIVVPPASRLPGLEVRRNGVAVPAELFDTTVPVDPGTYAIEAAAAGHKLWSSTVEAAAIGGDLRIEVPRLEPVPEVPEPAKIKQSIANDKPAKPAPVAGEAGHEPAVDSGARRRRHLISYTVGGAGLAALGVGAVFGVMAHSKWNDAGGHCAGDVCDATGIKINHDARSLGTTGTIIGGIGVAAVAAAIVVYLTAPSAQPAVEHAGVQLLPHGGGIATWTARF